MGVEDERLRLSSQLTKIGKQAAKMEREIWYRERLRRRIMAIVSKAEAKRIMF